MRAGGNSIMGNQARREPHGLTERGIAVAVYNPNYFRTFYWVTGKRGIYGTRFHRDEGRCNGGYFVLA